MPKSNALISHSQEWEWLVSLSNSQRKVRISDLFEKSPNRFNDFSVKAGPLLLDFSKTPISEYILDALFALADRACLGEGIDQLFAGAPVNNTEGRPACHPSQRALNKEDIRKLHGSMLDFVTEVHNSREIPGTGLPVEDVIHIGIGGSDLGPRLVVDALHTREDGGPKVHFVSGSRMDRLAELMEWVDPARVLVIVVSKSFSTLETLSRLDAVMEWLKGSLSSTDAMSRIVGVSANTGKMTAFGIAPERQFVMEEGVGGRYSLWSAAGISIALALGVDKFVELLQGAASLDEHFLNKPWRENLPVLKALVHIWEINFCNKPVNIVLPYHPRLRLLPTYLQQLTMESNGKSVNRNGQPINYKTSPFVFGQLGNDSQHSFLQAVHQGAYEAIVDFLIVRDPASEDYRIEAASCLAQSRALMMGNESAGAGDRLALHRKIQGNNSSSTLVIDDLNAFSLGYLLAMYEQQVYAQSVIWDINPFDQWGVELGKAITRDLLAIRQDRQSDCLLDDSTRALLHYLSDDEVGRSTDSGT